jgi:SAM-dependent methyltransferase
MPLSPLRPLLRPADFPSWTEYYWEYQHRLACDYLIPTLERWGVWGPGRRVLDVGCGDGGGTCAFAEAGAHVVGVELDPRLLESARERARARGLALTLVAGDITRPQSLQGLPLSYDLVLFRDVLEHVPDRDAALHETVARLAPGGSIVVDFPPYLSPYGGHQQTLHPPRRLGVRWAKLPFVHWLPQPWLRALAAGRDGADDPQWEEVMSVRRARLTLRALRESALRHGLRVAAAEHYLLRPTFRLRYGLPVVGAGVLASVPCLREALITGCYELLQLAAAPTPRS